MESNDAVLKCMTCGATLDVPAVSDLIAEEAFWHRRHFHQELAELDFITKLPSERSASALTVLRARFPPTSRAASRMGRADRAIDRGRLAWAAGFARSRVREQSPTFPSVARRIAPSESGVDAPRRTRLGSR